jgi:hypothetical protein
MNRGILVVVKRAPVEEVRDGHGDYVRDHVGRGGDDDDRPEAPVSRPIRASQLRTCRGVAGRELSGVRNSGSASSAPAARRANVCAARSERNGGVIR